jgi:hypothetical protein
VSSALSTMRICDTFTTLAFGRLASPFFKSTLPGAFPAQIRGNQADHARCNRTPVENIVLDHHARMPLCWR